MVRDEFDKWLNFHRGLFPQVTDWLATVNFEAVATEWAKALERTRFEDAMKCTRKMLTGEVEHPSNFDLARLPGVICQACPREAIPFSQLQGKRYNPTTGEVS